MMTAPVAVGLTCLRTFAVLVVVVVEETVAERLAGSPYIAAEHSVGRMFAGSLRIAAVVAGVVAFPWPVAVGSLHFSARDIDRTSAIGGRCCTDGVGSVASSDKFVADEELFLCTICILVVWGIHF